MEQLKRSDSIRWPEKYRLLGIDVSRTDYDDAVKAVIQAAQQRIPAIVTHLPIHGIVVASRDADLGAKINSFDIVAPDGHPVRWALNMLYKTKLADRVYGPEMMLRLTRRAAETGVGVFLYGSSPEVVEKLSMNLIRLFPSVRIAGYESPPYRRLTEREDDAAVARINGSEAGLIFLGLGCPLQDIFAYEHRDSIKGVQVCVGAAFDFHAGTKKIAPGWMQRNGLEWFYRLTQEPGRLWRRYLITNSIFLAKVFREIVLSKFSGSERHK